MGRTTFNVPLSAATFALWIKPAADSSATVPRIFDGFGGYVHASSARTAYDLTIKEPTGAAFTFSGANEPWCLDKGQWTHLALVRRPVRHGDGSYAVDIVSFGDKPREVCKALVGICCAVWGYHLGNLQENAKVGICTKRLARCAIICFIIR